jgi:branched-chain amino acid transport system ATP-binding protein
VNAPAALLAVKGLRVAHGRNIVLENVSLELTAGEALTLFGPEGSGKSTLLATIAGLTKPAGGSIRFDGAEIAGLDSARVCNLGIVLVPEGRQIFPALSVADNLKAGATIERARSQASALYERVYELFPKLAERRAQIAGTLSGGEQQLLAIGRCLMSAPRLMLLDEPTQGLAEPTRDQVYGALAALRAGGMALMLADADEQLARAFADHTCLIANGRAAPAD